MSDVADMVRKVAGLLTEQLEALLLAPGASASLVSVAFALAVASSFFVLRRRRRGRRPPGPKSLVRALFPRHILASPSMRADIGFFIFNAFVPAVLLGWAVLGYGVVSDGVHAALVSAFGARAPSSLPGPLVSGLVTVALFLAYDLAYWTDHSLSHKIPFLWAFHKVHHTAEVLTPVTNFRVHPVDSIVFANITAVFVGTASALAAFGFGRESAPYTLSGSNIVLVVFVFAVVHLQHSHIWIPFTGIWGRIFVSPAHHQLHHSSDPADFDRNFGSCLAVWDWIFGTLNMPSRSRRRLVFGVGAVDPAANTVTGGLITPFVEAARQVGGVLRPSGRARVAAN